MGEADNKMLTPVFPPILGAASEDLIAQAVTEINESKTPVLLLGMSASRPETAQTVRTLFANYQ